VIKEKEKGGGKRRGKRGFGNAKTTRNDTSFSFCTYMGKRGEKGGGGKREGEGGKGKVAVARFGMRVN